MIVLIEAEIEKKKEILAQSLTLRENELGNAKDEMGKMKKKMTKAKSDFNRKIQDLEKKVLIKNEEIDDIKLQYSEGEFDKMLKICEKKDRMIKELQNENDKLKELKGYYEQILEKYETEVSELKKRNEELDEGEEVRNIGKTLDVLKMKLMFYEGQQEKVGLNELTQQVKDLEQKLQTRNQDKDDGNNNESEIFRYKLIF